MRSIAAALAALALAGCGSACQDLADRVCDCQPAGTLRDNCKSAVKNQIGSGAQKPTQSDQELCQQLLQTCVTNDTQNLCDYIQTPAGKKACGLSY